MRITKHHFIALTAGLFVFGFSDGSEAQDCRTTTGVIIGCAEWHEINSDESDFSVSERTDNFLIQKKKLPSRTQELWKHKESAPNSPLLHARYERLHTGHFSRQNFDSGFENLFNGLLRKSNVTFDNAIQVEKVGRDFKVAWANGPENSLCIVGLKMFGESDVLEASGTKSVLIIICKKDDGDRVFLKNALLSFLGNLKSDGKPVVRRPNGVQPFSFYEAKIFGLSTNQPSAQTPTNAPDKPAGTWDERSIAFQWQGVEDLVAGKILLSESNGQGRMQATLPRGQGTCTGQYEMITRQRGKWVLACTNGMTASGDFEAFGSGKGSSGSGVDSQGNKIKFTVGGR